VASRPTLPVAGPSRDALLRPGRDVTALTWFHFPRGFAEQPTPRRRILIDIPYGKIEDAGIQDYGEFFAGLDYAWHLLHEAPPTVDGQPGQVSVVDRFLNAIQLKWRPASA
jgi:hypothetical protein